MKILIYCQHVLGIGHLFRTLEIAEALYQHEVVLLLGGPTAEITPGRHIRVVQLPGLEMDASFSSLMPTDKNIPLDEIKKRRQEMIQATMQDFRPDILVIELFPFGRNGFSFELIPLLEAIRSGDLPRCKVVCSLRDILVEKKNQTKFEQRAIDRINSLFDALLIHGDPKVITLDETFSRMKDITVPLVYTGYITEKMNFQEACELKARLQLDTGEKLIVVSAGGGNVGFQLLNAAIDAFAAIDFPARIQLFTGPYLTHNDFRSLQEKKLPGLTVERFAGNFSSWIGAADLSVSMGGYNTIMNILAAGTPALVFPFRQNREQKMRADRLSAIANIVVLDEEDLAAHSLAELIKMAVTKEKQQTGIRLDGAEWTSRWLDQWTAEEQRHA